MGLGSGGLLDFSEGNQFVDFGHLFNLLLSTNVATETVTGETYSTLGCVVSTTLKDFLNSLFIRSKASNFTDDRTNDVNTVA